MSHFERIWKRIEEHQGEIFRQIRGQEFTYDVISGAVLPSTTNQQLPKSHFEQASELLPLENTVPVQHLRGPSYLYAILMDQRILDDYMDFEEREYYLRTFEDLLYDAVYLLYFAFDTKEDDYEDDVIGPFIRSSILNSVLLLECGANCLIDGLNLPGQFYSDIEKLPFLSKFEFFLNKVSSKQSFDRGCKEIQAISELKSIRDFYVHPKVKKARYKKIGKDSWDTDFGKTKFLGFPRQPRLWNKENAILALKSVNEFFNKFFLEWCNLKPNAVIDLLLSNDKADMNAPRGATIDGVGGLDRAVNDWNIDFKFIGKVVWHSNASDE